ncbi:MAG: HK97-gp10 family putative phage morphogenesis protein [Candidatus Dehalobacter alkaniphilus]
MGKNYMRLDSKLDDMLIDIMAAGGKIDDAAEKALVESVKPIHDDMKEVIKKHRKTGLTESSLREASSRNVEWDVNRAVIRVGFDVKKGGLPALFLEYGTPKQKAEPFIQPSIERNKAKTRKIQKRILGEILEELVK